MKLRKGPVTALPEAGLGLRLGGGRGRALELDGDPVHREGVAQGEDVVPQPVAAPLLLSLPQRAKPRVDAEIQLSGHHP